MKIDTKSFNLLLCLFSSSLYGDIGVNKFDLLKQYFGTTSGGDGSVAYQRTTKAMAKKAIADAQMFGIPFMRVSASGYFPIMYNQKGDLALWQIDPVQYWNVWDEMMSDLASHHIKIVPTLMWNLVQFPAMTGETVDQMIKDPSSQSYQLLKKFISEFVSRYKSHPALYFYELTNELNLAADLDNIARCQKSSNELAVCAPRGNFSTDEMIVFTRSLTQLIHSMDGNHQVSSGFSVPRLSATHLRRHPEWIDGGADWTKDTIEEYENYLIDSHRGVDIISVHMYPNPPKESLRFGTEEALIQITADAASMVQKPLYIGEFGSPYEGGYMNMIIQAISKFQVPIASVWSWEDYRKSLVNPTTDQNSINIEPGFSDRTIEEIVQVNGAFLSKNGDDVTKPNVVLTWPIECSNIRNDTFQVYAVASDNQRVDRVEFWIDNQKLISSQFPPYVGNIHMDEKIEGEYQIIAKVFDQSGNMNEYNSKILYKMDDVTWRRCIQIFSEK